MEKAISTEVEDRAATGYQGTLKRPDSDTTSIFSTAIRAPRETTSVNNSYEISGGTRGFEGVSQLLRVGDCVTFEGSIMGKSVRIALFSCGLSPPGKSIFENKSEKMKHAFF